MDSILHLQLHQARVDAAVRHAEHVPARRPRPPSPGREVAARHLRRIADALDAHEVAPRHA